VKRAEVYRNRNRRTGSEWVSTVHEGEVPLRGLPIWDREDATGHDDYFPTHAEALHAALEAVCLTPANPEPMEAP